MAKLDPTAKLLVRIKVDNPKSVEFEVHCAFDAQIVRNNDSSLDLRLTVHALLCFIGWPEVWCDCPGGLLSG